MEKPKIKGMPGRQKQNAMFLIGGLLAGILGTIGVVMFMMRQPPVEAPLPVQELPTIMPSAIAEMLFPTPPPTFTPNYQPAITETYPPAPAPTSTPVARTDFGQSSQANPVRAIAIAPNATLMAVAYEYNGGYILELRRFLPQGLNMTGDIIQIGADRVDQLAFSPAGDKLLAMSNEGSIVVYNVASRTEMTRFSSYYRAAFTPDGKRLILGGGSEKVTINDGDDFYSLTQLPRKGWTHAVAVTNEQMAVAFTDGGYRIQVMNIAQPETVLYEYTTDKPVHEVKFSPDGTLLAAAFGSQVIVYELATGKEYDFDMSYMGLAWSLAFSPDGTWLAAGGGIFEEGFAAGTYVWKRDITGSLPEGQFGTESRLLAGHLHDVNSIAFTPNGMYLLTGSTDGTLRLWDYANTGAEADREDL